MYEAFFQLQTRPFPATPAVAKYFPSQSMEAARGNLLRAMERAEGPGLVIGPPGVGKTLLLRVLAELFTDVFRVVLLSGSRVNTRKSLLQSILFELDLPYRGMDEGELRLTLIDALRRNEAIPRGILLLIDEAQTLPLRLLDEARLITNVAQDGQPRVRLVLAGSPQLEERFTSPKLESFNQRIAARCYLQSFNRDETNEFVRAQVSWAGGDPDLIFAHDTLRAIFQATDGIPRLVNQVCDHALVLAHAAGQNFVDAGRIQEAWADMQQLPPPWQPTNPSGPGGGGGSGGGNTVIEFGQLDDEAPTSASCLNGDGRLSCNDSDPYVAQNDSPSVELKSTISELTTDSVTINPQFLEGSVEWIQCGEQPANVPIRRPVESDPFVDAFDEEVVVIDRFEARNLEGFRGRTRVSCQESRELAACLSQIQDKDVAANLQTVCDAAATRAAEPATSPAFEFSTLQDLPEIDLPCELNESLTSIGRATDEQIDLDFDEEVDCVPLPWTRGTISDDRDIIIVDDDLPQSTMKSSQDPAAESTHRTEYRELFAQLRRVSS